jgi:molecular chaperone IbpA
MSRNDFSRLFDQLEAMSLGFGPVFRNFTTPTNNYPPHNIIMKTENVFILELAVAGFKKHEITVTEHQGELVIRGNRDNGFSEDPKEDTYQFRGIGRRNFEKTFKMAEFLEIVDATLEDGILSITLMRNVPEEAQPKLIAIK